MMAERYAECNSRPEGVLPVGQNEYTMRPLSGFFERSYTGVLDAGVPGRGGPGATAVV